MKKLFLCLAGAAAALTLNAKVWRVNYDENAKADFKTIAAACATTLVSDGDTLYMEPGLHNGSSTDNTISRPLTILGPGWGFQANNGAISSVPTATFGNTIIIRADNVSVVGITTSGSISIDRGLNIRVERCKVGSTISTNYTGTGFVTNLIIRNNICNHIYVGGGSLQTPVVIENNIVFDDISALASSYNGNHVFIRHNTVYGTISQGSYRTVCDNIIFYDNNYSKPIDFKKTYDNYRFYNNVLAISQEQYDADQTSVSPVGYSNYADNIFAGATFANTCTDSIAGIWFDDAMRYQVRSDSPAKNAATDGTDCGAFGGEHPFVLYGRPEGIPYIYDVEVPAYPTDNKLNISFKVAGQNE